MPGCAALGATIFCEGTLFGLSGRPAKPPPANAAAVETFA
jgi:hypothetical protein